jgi:hypothetical protein
MEAHKQRLSSMSNQQKTANPTGADKKPALRVAFDSRLRLEFHGSKPAPGKTEGGLEKCLANPGSRRKITQKAHAGCEHDPIWKMSVKILTDNQYT